MDTRADLGEGSVEAEYYLETQSQHVPTREMDVSPNLEAMASNLRAMASILEAMASC